MKCSFCGSEFSGEATHCPSCGVMRPSSTTGPAPTDSGSSPYGPPLNSYDQNPYGLSNSQNVPYSPQPQYPTPISASPPPRRHKMMISIILGAVALVLILGGVAAFASFRGPHPPTSTTTHLSTPTVTIPIVTIPYSPHSGKLVLNDSLRDSSSHNFGEGRDTESGITCQFKNGAYNVQSTGDSMAMCVAPTSNFSNFVYEVQMTIIKGDGGGIFFRADFQSAKFYTLFVGADGVYALSLYTDSSHTQILRNTTLSDAIKQGLNQTNLIAVSAIGNTTTLYINHQQLVSVNDSTYSHGQIGFVAESYANSDHPTEVVFSNAKVWTLP